MTTAAEPLWPTLFDPAIIAEFKAMGDDEWRKLYHQKWPVPEAGDGDDGRNHRDIKRHRRVNFEDRHDRTVH